MMGPYIAHQKTDHQWANLSAVVATMSHPGDPGVHYLACCGFFINGKILRNRNPNLSQVVTRTSRARHGGAEGRRNRAVYLVSVRYLSTILTIDFQITNRQVTIQGFRPPNLSYPHESIQIVSHRLNTTPCVARCP